MKTHLTMPYDLHTAQRHARASTAMLQEYQAEHDTDAEMIAALDALDVAQREIAHLIERRIAARRAARGA